ncbi:hypothetical protein Ct9H90mP29_15710 [bacterium]|nr:MAG: hypothetical protein Ct9H90mP29_15710 [bacterium]
MSINKMLLGLDPYTVYMENEEKDGLKSLQKEKMVEWDSNWIAGKSAYSHSPIANSPAKRAGILMG